MMRWSERGILSHEVLLQRRVASRVRHLRLARGLTQEALAARAGIAVRHVQKIEAGEINTTLRTIARLALALEVDPSEIFREE
jgi:transcriptional regulator with XRE-family HTH domain